jgi:hypothetical protein
MESLFLSFFALFQLYGVSLLILCKRRAELKPHIGPLQSTGSTEGDWSVRHYAEHIKDLGDTPTELFSHA